MAPSPIVAALVCVALAPGFARAAPPECPATVDGLRLTVVCDDHPGDPGLTPETGFACLVEGPETTVLFDTGGSPAVLAHNLDALGVDPADIGVVVLSHAHSDHTGGLPALLRADRPPTVYVPTALADGIRTVAGDRARVAPVSGPMSILPGVCSLGPMADGIAEQAMVVHTPRGLVVLTGCAHPGLTAVVERARDLMGAEILLVAGGFHLRRTEPARAEAVARRLAELGVRHVGPCHCTGAEATAALETVFGARCHRLGVGARLALADLE